MKKLVILGAGGHARVVRDIAKDYYDEIVLLDDDKNNTYADGPINSYSKYKDNYDFFIGIGDNNKREELFETLEKERINIISVISKDAIISDDVLIGDGTVVMPGSIINTGTQIGKCAIVNTGASIDHDCILDDFSHISVGSHLAGTVKIGKRVFLGAGTIVINNINICEDVITGANTTVIRDIIEKGTYVDTPAKKIK